MAAGEETTAESLRKGMTEAEWQRIYEMSQDKSLYQNMNNSLFPTIHGQLKKDCYIAPHS